MLNCYSEVFAESELSNSPPAQILRFSVLLKAVSCNGGACSEQELLTSTVSVSVSCAPFPWSCVPCCVDSVCLSVPVFVQAWFCLLEKSHKGLSGAHLLSSAPALCRAADTVCVFSTVCFTFSADQICMIKELEASHCAILGTSLSQFW